MSNTPDKGHCIFDRMSGVLFVTVDQFYISMLFGRKFTFLNILILIYFLICEHF